MPAASAAQAIRAALDAEPDGVLDDIARRLGVPLRVVLDLLPPARQGALPARAFRKSGASSRSGAQ
jgi:putative heme iron utilization protein